MVRTVSVSVLEWDIPEGHVPFTPAHGLAYCWDFSHELYQGIVED